MFPSRLRVVVALVAWLALPSAVSRAQRVAGRCAASLPADARYVRHMSVHMGNRLWPFVILLPPGYDTSTARYPVIYHFHGRTDDECIGPDRGMIQRVRTAAAGLPPFIYVFLNGGPVCSYVDAGSECPTLRPESYILNELIPYVDAQYRTIAGRAGRALDGFSMGGAGVARFGYVHPDRFCSFVAYSGARAPAELQANASKAVAAGLMTRFVVGGGEGGRVDDVRSHFMAAKAAGLPAELETVPGVGHDLPELYRVAGARGLAVHFRCFAAAGAKPGADAGASEAGGARDDAAPEGGVADVRREDGVAADLGGQGGDDAGPSPAADASAALDRRDDAASTGGGRPLPADAGGARDASATVSPGARKVSRGACRYGGGGDAPALLVAASLVAAWRARRGRAIAPDQNCAPNESPPQGKKPLVPITGVNEARKKKAFDRGVKR